MDDRDPSGRFVRGLTLGALLGAIIAGFVDLATLEGGASDRAHHRVDRSGTGTGRDAPAAAAPTAEPTSGEVARR